MTLARSAFAEAKQLLTHAKDAARVDTNVPAEGDRLYTWFRLPLYEQSSAASNYLLYTALQTEFGCGGLHVEGDDAFIGIPAEGAKEGFPAHRLQQGLHRLRKALLSALEQHPDGNYVINKQRITIPGIRHVDVEDLTKALVSRHHAWRGIVPEHQIETTYELPRGMVYIDEQKLRHSGEVNQGIYGHYLSEKAQQGEFSVPFNQAERRLKIDGTVLKALYQQLGVDLNARSVN